MIHKLFILFIILVIVSFYLLSLEETTISLFLIIGAIAVLATMIGIAIKKHNPDEYLLWQINELEKMIWKVEDDKKRDVLCGLNAVKKTLGEK